MKILLNSFQLQAVSDFSLDVAKGLMLAGILGQGFVTVELPIIRVLGSVLVIMMSLLFLLFGVELRRKLKK